MEVIRHKEIEAGGRYYVTMVEKGMDWGIGEENGVVKGDFTWYYPMYVCSVLTRVLPAWYYDKKLTEDGRCIRTTWLSR